MIPTETLIRLLPLALRAAGRPELAALVEELGPALGPHLDELLRRHEAGEPLEVPRAELPDVARVVREAERE